MPIFEFRCRPCHHEFETLVRNGETPKCPKCDESSVDKLMSAAAGRVAQGSALPVVNQSCPPADAPPCSPSCCRL